MTTLYVIDYICYILLLVLLDYYYVQKKKEKDYWMLDK